MRFENIERFKDWINENAIEAEYYDFDNLDWLYRMLSDKIYANASEQSVSFELSAYETKRRYTMTYDFQFIRDPRFDNDEFCGDQSEEFIFIA